MAQRRAFLGDVIVFSVTDVSVDLARLRQALAEQQLRTDALKHAIRRIDAFKRASSEVAVRFPAERKGVRRFLIIKQIGQDSRESRRAIVLAEETRSPTGGRVRVKHETLYRIMYDRGVRNLDGSVRDDDITVEQQIVPDLVLTHQERAWLAETVGEDGVELRRRFEHHARHLDSHGVRAFIRDYLTLLDAVAIKDGVYFVAASHRTEVRAFASVINGIGSSMHLIPLVDSAEQRKMITSAAAEDCAASYESLRRQADTVLAATNRTVTPSTHESLASSLDQLARRVGSYERLLDQPIPNLETSRELATQAVTQLVSRISRPGHIERRCV